MQTPTIQLHTDEDGTTPIAIVGSRSWPDDELHLVDQWMEHTPKNVRFVSGDGGKVDLRVRSVAERLGRRFTAFPVDKTGLPTDPAKRKWEFTARAHARDRQIAEECFYLVAFWNPYKAAGIINKHGGTRYTVKHARELQRPVLVILPKGIDPRLKQHQI